jgi:DivIVA domain-containing protein
MTDTERRQQRLITSTPQLTPEEIATRSFGTGFRGYAEAEVRSFLKRISEQLVATKDHQTDLEAAIDSLEEQLRQPRPLSEQELLDALGEETARLLRSAREAADKIRAKADERAEVVIDDATQAATRVREEAEEHATRRTQDTEERVNELVTNAETRVKELADNATAEAESLLETARQQGREMLEEAKSARERVLGDLVRRRALLNSQIEELRTGRDQLLDAYRTVKRTFLEATEALAQVEARAALERSTTVSEPLDIAAEIAAEIEALDGALDDTDTDTTASVDIDLVEAEGGDDAKVALADVDTLFARIRAGQGDGTARSPAEATAAAVTAVATEPLAATAPEPSEPRPDAAASEWRAKRAATVDPLLGPLLKKTKRTVQDDQNALLDAVRRHKGRPRAAQVLPDLDALLLSWGIVLHDAVDRAYVAGREAAGGERRNAEQELVQEAAEMIVVPLRDRITHAIDSGEEGDAGGLVERIGARYREWKNQSLEGSLAESLAFVWSRGVYDATPDDGVLWWIPFEEGRCSDCDDNGLEPTVKGKDFPTGQAFPPAHPGCRCLLMPAVLLNTPTATE